MKILFLTLLLSGCMRFRVTCVDKKNEIVHRETAFYVGGFEPKKGHHQCTLDKIDN